MIKKQAQSGFTLIETILVLGIATTGIFLGIQKQARDVEFDRAKLSGDQMHQIANALTGYINANYPALSTAAPGNVNDDVANGPRRCTAPSSGAGAVCEVSIETLVDNGFLRNFNAPDSATNVATAYFNGAGFYTNFTNPYGSPFRIFIRNYGGATPIVDGLIVTNNCLNLNTADPTCAATNPRYDLLGTAVQAIGANGGMSRASATSLTGYDGSYTALNADFQPTYYATPVRSVGQVGAMVGFNTGDFTEYLRRDGTLPMLGNMDMGEQSLVNVAQIQGSEIVSVLTPAQDPGGNDAAPTSAIRMSAVYVSGNPAAMANPNLTAQLFTDTNVPAQFNGQVTIADQGGAGTIDLTNNGQSLFVGTTQFNSQADFRGGLINNTGTLTFNDSTSTTGNAAITGTLTVAGATTITNNYLNITGTAGAPFSMGAGYPAAITSTPASLSIGSGNMYDLFIRNFNGGAQPVSTYLSPFVLEGIFAVHNGDLLTKPTCPSAGTPKLFVFPAIMNVGGTGYVTDNFNGSNNDLIADVFVSSKFNALARNTSATQWTIVLSSYEYFNNAGQDLQGTCTSNVRAAPNAAAVCTTPNSLPNSVAWAFVYCTY